MIISSINPVAVLFFFKHYIDFIPNLGIIIPIMGINIYDNKLSSYLFNKTSRNLLALFYGHSDESFYVNQILQKVGGGSGAVQRELKLMTEAGIITRERKGNIVFYQANGKSPVFNELKSIVRKTFGVADVLKEVLEPLAEKIRVAFVFGSVASSTENKASDLDLMIIGDITFDEVLSCISQAEKTIQREINPVVYPVAEFRQKLQTDNHFVKTVLESKKIFVIGDESELARLAEE